MTDDQDEPTRADNHDTPQVDGPTHYGPTGGHLGPAPADPAPSARPDIDGGPTVAFTPDENTVAESSFVNQLFPGLYGDDITTSDVTTTGPTVGGWPTDQPEPPLGELIWRVDQPPVDETVRRAPAYYAGLGVALLLVVGLLAVAAYVTVNRPTQRLAGTAQPSPTSPTTPPITTTAAPTKTTTTGEAPRDPLAQVAAHPLSSATTRMADTTCELPRFDPADDRQATFYAAAKTCADNAWRDVLAQADLDGAVQVVTVTSNQQTSCGEVTPTSPATHCEGTVYLTPAYLRDTEQNGRYPGKYLGVLLRGYAGALQNTTGLTDLLTTMDTGDAADLDTRLAQQATCLAGVVSGAMAGRGAVDANITGEIAARLTTVDAPKDAKSWLDKGFAERTPAACNTWRS